MGLPVIYILVCASWFYDKSNSIAPLMAITTYWGKRRTNIFFTEKRGWAISKITFCTAKTVGKNVEQEIVLSSSCVRLNMKIVNFCMVFPLFQIFGEGPFIRSGRP